jgi:hypothetical protein
MSLVIGGLADVLRPPARGDLLAEEKGLTDEPHDPIRRIELVSTGSVAIRPEHVASTWKPMMLWLTTSRRWTDPRPINVYVIEHERGLVLFDTDRIALRSPTLPTSRAG